MKPQRLNHYYPAAIFAESYSPYVSNNKKLRQLKVSYINSHNLCDYILQYKKQNIKSVYDTTDVSFIYTEIMNKRNYDIINKVEHNNRILGEKDCNSIFTNIALIEDENDKNNEKIVQKIERDFLSFLKKFKSSLQSKTPQDMTMFLDNNKEDILKFLSLTIDRVPFFSKEQVFLYKNILSNCNLLCLDAEQSKFIMSDLLPIVPTCVNQIRTLKSIYETNQEFENSETPFPFSDDDISILEKYPVLVFPVTNSSIMIFFDKNISHLISNPFIEVSIRTLYFVNTMIYSYKLVIYNLNNEQEVLNNVIEQYLNTDIEIDRQQFVEPYKNILHSEL